MTKPTALEIFGHWPTADELYQYLLRCAGPAKPTQDERAALRNLSHRRDDALAVAAVLTRLTA